MKLLESRELAESLLRKHRRKLFSSGWHFEFDDSCAHLGCCDSHKKIIFISRYFAFLNDEIIVEDVILHEIAHAMCDPAEGHSQSWRKNFLKIGGSGQRLYSDYVKPPSKLIGKCAGNSWWSGCAWTFRVNRKFGSCPKCVKIFHPRANVVSLINWRLNPEWTRLQSAVLS